MSVTIIDDIERAGADADLVNRSSDEAELVAGARAGHTHLPLMNYLSAMNGESMESRTE